MTATDGAKGEGRQHPRAAITLEVSYRTTGSFLVSYSLNLSAGGLFLETDQAVPIGSQIVVRFAVPGAATAVETRGTVVWARARGDEGEMPAGIGIKFEDAEQQVGELIDEVVHSFAGMCIVAVAVRGGRGDRLARYLKSIMSWEVLQATVDDLSACVGDKSVDLLVVDLDATGRPGMSVFPWARSCDPVVPVVALAGSAEAASAARAAGAANVIGEPFSFEALRSCVLEVIARPTSIPGGEP